MRGHDDAEGDDRGDGDPAQDRQAQDDRAGKRLEPVAHLVAVDPFAVGQQKDDASENGHGSQRHHDRRDIQFPYKDAVEHAQCGAQADGDRQDR